MAQDAPRGPIAVLIPALNCAQTIGEVVRGARDHVPAVLVVDDGSTDTTAEVARAAGAAVLSHSRNLGKGAALLTGFRHLRDDGCRWAVTMDGDGQHFGNQIPVLLDAVREGSPALVVGQRRLEGIEVAGINLFGNRFANRWVEIACGRPIPDTQSGFRLYPIAETLALGTRSGRFAFETEVLIRAARSGLDIRSVPVKVYYPPPKERKSHYRTVHDTVRIILMVLRLLLRL
jgi:glycosyltransferase involved in cell wall biosynthesis